ncbi:MAG: uncharacterized protein K0R15_1670 [Clostridiales bacterium]|jgi:putative membrane protein|nr:uncharacterized protein [Clostridiales bacterium]
MMYGRGFYGNGGNFGGDNFRNGCFGNGGYGFMNNGWNIFIALTILLVVAFVIYLLVHKNSKISKQSSLELLRMKYAQGEITDEEYLKRKEVLGKR